MFCIVLEPISTSLRPYSPVSEKIIINRFPFVIGRHGSCEYQIDEPQISRWHCRFVDAGTEVQVSDLESRNGTYLNSLRVVAAQPIQTGDILSLGRWQFRIDVHSNFPPEGSMPLTESDIEANTAQ